MSRRGVSEETIFYSEAMPDTGESWPHRWLLSLCRCSS